MSKFSLNKGDPDVAHLFLANLLVTGYQHQWKHDWYQVKNKKYIREQEAAAKTLLVLTTYKGYH